MSELDIKIIGAGPAGLVAGLKFLEAGFYPTIIEKQQVIVSTLCGEGLSHDTISRVPFKDWSEYAPSTFDYATFIFPNGTKSYVKKKCHTMDRTSWFRAMAKEFEKRGGHLQLGTKVNDVKDLKYDLLIGADGPLSTVSKYVGNKSANMTGVQTRLKLDYKHDGMEFFIDKRFSQEYSWVFAKGGIFNVGVLGDMKQLDAFVKHMGFEKAEVVDRLGYNIPFFGTKVQRDNVILTGDAAGITNPLTKGGMAAAIFAAEIIVDCVKEGKINEYESRIMNHPIMSPVYKDALQYYRELTNEELNKVGNLVNGMDLTNLSKLFKAKLLLAGLLKPKKLKTIMKASSLANKYSW